MPATEKYLEAKERMREAKKEAAKVVQEAFKESAAEVFAKHAKLESFGWHQYTPYFNDGDECVFGTHIDEPDINGQQSWDIEALRETIRRPTGRTIEVSGFSGRIEKQQQYENVANEAFDPELKAASDAVRGFLGGFDTEDFRDMFGDHMEVTVSRDGTISTEQYEHD